MKQYIFLLILAVLVFGSIYFVTAGVDGGGSLGDPTYYCRTSIAGNWIGENLELGDLECDTFPYPTSIADARLIGGDTNIKCQAKVDDLPYGDEAEIGDLGFTEMVWYNFKIKQLSVGHHTIIVRCQGDAYEVSRTYERTVEVI